MNIKYLQTLKTTKKMKHILNVLKNEIFNLHNTINDLVKKVTVSQESYLKDRSNEALFNNWSEKVKDLQKSESDMRYLRSAYATICTACEVEPMTVEEIVSERTARETKKVERKERKAAIKKNDKADETSK